MIGQSPTQVIEKIQIRGRRRKRRRGRLLNNESIVKLLWQSTVDDTLFYIERNQRRMGQYYVAPVFFLLRG